MAILESIIISGNFLNQSPVFDIRIQILDIFFDFRFNDKRVPDCCITDTF